MLAEEFGQGDFKICLTYYADIRIQRKFSNSEDFANLNNNVAYQEQLHLPELWLEIILLPSQGVYIPPTHSC
jgi:hypothetical protein